MSQGLVYIFTGDGKGKTSAALGTALRAVGHGKKVAMVQFYKERKWGIGEHDVRVILSDPPAGGESKDLFRIYPMGAGFYFPPKDKDKHQKAAEKALKFAEKQIAASRSGTRNDGLFLLVLDEALNALHDGLIRQISLIRLIGQRNTTHIILTGRNCPKELIDMADLVTEMKNIKHPFQKGQKAVIGLDY